MREFILLTLLGAGIGLALSFIPTPLQYRKDCPPGTHQRMVVDYGTPGWHRIGSSEIKITCEKDLAAIMPPIETE